MSCTSIGMCFIITDTDPVTSKREPGGDANDLLYLDVLVAWMLEGRRHVHDFILLHRDRDLDKPLNMLLPNPLAMDNRRHLRDLLLNHRD